MTSNIQKDMFQSIQGLASMENWKKISIMSKNDGYFCFICPGISLKKVDINSMNNMYAEKTMKVLSPYYHICCYLLRSL